MKKKKFLKSGIVIICIFVMVLGQSVYATGEIGLPENAEIEEGQADTITKEDILETEEDSEGEKKEAGEIKKLNETPGNHLSVSPQINEEQLHQGWYLDENNDWYYFNSKGEKYLGWLLLDGIWYYLNEENNEKQGVMIKDSNCEIAGQTYFFDGSGHMQTGWVLRPEGWYYTNEGGAKQEGWQYLGGYWYYLNPIDERFAGLMLQDESSEIADQTYFFNGSGHMQIGWVLRQEGWYYTNVSGAKQVGWQYLGGYWYYLNPKDERFPGLMLQDESSEIAGQTYFFNGSGHMQIGWVLRQEGWYYTNGSGAKHIGWLYIGGKWYYLDANNQEFSGLMLANCEKLIGENTYYFNPNGTMRTGWFLDGKGWYYYDDSGLIASGWRLVNGNWFYMDPQTDNKMVSNGWKDFSGTWYYFYSGGQMATNWLQVGASWYYMSGDGAMRTGWQFIGSDWYYFYGQNDSHGGIWGVMASNTTIDGYQIRPDGRMLSEAERLMSLRAQTYNSNTNWLILIDRASCKVGVFSGRFGAWNLVNFWSCAPGTAATPTVGGVFTIQSRGYYFDSGASRCYWYTQFYGNYLFHSVLYNKNGTLRDGRVGIPLSHGCVRLEINNAKWIYDSIPSGTKVVSY